MMAGAQKAGSQHPIGPPSLAQDVFPNSEKTAGVERVVERVSPSQPAPVPCTTSCFGAKLFPSAPFSRRDNFARITDVEIYYGTMFGSAEQYARSLAHEVSIHRPVRVTIHDLDGFEELSFARERLTPTRLFVFVLSTHFAGSPSPSAERFYHWITHLVAPLQAIASPSPGNKPWWWSSSSRTSSRKSLSARWRQTPLAGMHYVVFGIGDSMYLTFNATGKFVDARLKELGASRLLPLGLGDCSNDVEAIYKAWELGLLHRLPRPATSVLSEIRRASKSAVRRLSQLSPSITPSAASPGSPRASLVAGSHSRRGDADLSGVMPSFVVRDNFGRIVPLRFQCLNLRTASLTARALPIVSIRSSSPTRSLGSISSRPRSPRIALFDDTSFAEIVPIERVGNGSSTANQRLPERTSGLFKVRLLNPTVTYTTVGSLAIFPHNDPEQVQEIVDAFHYDLDAEIELYVDEAAYPNPAALKAERQQLPFPTPCTIRTALTEFLEIRTVTAEFVRIAAGFVVSLDDKAFLECLSADGSTAFKTQIQDQQKGILDLIAMAPTLQIPWSVFVNIAQPIKPRYFTIASSPKLSPRDLDLAVAFGSTGQPPGLATSFFDRILTERSVVPIRGFISVSRFKFHDDGVAPLVFIATGVGFAPMRAIVHERLMQWAQMASASRGRTNSGSFGSTIPKQLLFLGAANEASIVYLNDVRRWEQQSVVHVRYAFSRDDAHPRRYVQDVVATRMDEIVETVKASPDARIFVCGRITMVRRIREIFEADQLRRGSAWFSTIHKSGRFIEEGYH